MKPTPKKILICGLPSSGKTTLAYALRKKIQNSIVLDGDGVRYSTGNNDFSYEGRLQQARNMRDLAAILLNQGHYVICSFVCPTHELRDIFGADFTIWMDTIAAGPYQDTNKMWQDLAHADLIFEAWTPSENMAAHAIPVIFPPPPKFDWEHPSAVMIGRFQPWHKGHRALFEKALEKYGQVSILIRVMPNSPDNPWDISYIMDLINNDLKTYEGKYRVNITPNVAAVVYGRDVGYDVDRIELPPEIEAISATEIRRKPDEHGYKFREDCGPTGE